MFDNARQQAYWLASHSLDKLAESTEENMDIGVYDPYDKQELAAYQTLAARLRLEYDIHQSIQEIFHGPKPEPIADGEPAWLTFAEDDVSSHEIWGCRGCRGQVTRAAGTIEHFDASFLIHEKDCPEVHAS